MEPPKKEKRAWAQSKPFKGFKTELKNTVVRNTRPADRMSYQDLGQKDKVATTRLDKLRGKQAPVYTNAVLDDLINIILNAKKDIVKVNGLDDYETAANYAEKHGLRISEESEDINHDGVDDVVLYNKQGRPVIVNGYKLVPSKQPLRKEFLRAKREGDLDNPSEGYRGWVKQVYGAGEFNDQGERELAYDKHNLPPDLQRLKLAGWQIPNAPKREKSMHQRIMDLVRAGYDELMERVCEGRAYIRGLMPRFKVMSLAYIIGIDANIWQHALDEEQREQIRAQADQVNGLSGVEGDLVTLFESYKAFKEKNKKQVNQFLKDNWEAIVDTDFCAICGEILSEIGAGPDDIEGAFPTDDQVKLLDDPEQAEAKTEFKGLKSDYKLQWASACDRYKNTKTEELFE